MLRYPRACPTIQDGLSPGLLAADGCGAHPLLRLLWGPRASKVRGQAHSLEQTHARRGSQVEGRAHVSILGDVPDCLVQAFSKTLASARRIVCVAGDTPAWKETARWTQARRQPLRRPYADRLGRGAGAPKPGGSFDAPSQLELSGTPSSETKGPTHMPPRVSGAAACTVGVCTGARTKHWALSTWLSLPGGLPGCGYQLLQVLRHRECHSDTAWCAVVENGDGVDGRSHLLCLGSGGQSWANQDPNLPAKTWAFLSRMEMPTALLRCGAASPLRVPSQAASRGA